MGVKWPLFDLQHPYSIAEDVKNQVRKLIGGRKVGVTHEKMVKNDSSGGVRSQVGPKWVKSSP